MEEFEVHNIKQALEQIEIKYGLNWQDHYIIESNLTTDGTLRVVLKAANESNDEVKLDQIDRIIDKDIAIDDAEVSSVVDKIMKEYKDYDFSIDVSDDEMKAFLTIKPGPIKVKIKREEIIDFLSKENVVFGINEKILTRICKDYIDKRIDDILIAQGKYPIESVDSKVEYLFPKDGFIKIEETDENAKINFARQKKIFQCCKDNILVKKTPGVQGIDGYNIRGKKIIAGKFKDINLRQFVESNETIKISEDKNKLIAKCDGQPYLSKYGKVEIRKVFVVNKNIDYSIGDIEFDGSVIVHGDVEIPFEVHAKGDIHIDGVVRNTFITSESNLYIKGGVSGDGKAKVECKGNFTASHVNNVTIIADGNCIIEDYVLNSTVYSGNNIVIHGRGLFSGGALFAKNNISMKKAGSQAGVKTSISAGIRYMKMKEDYKRNSKIVSLFEKINELTTADFKLTKQIKAADTQQKKDHLSLLLAKIRLAKQKYLALIEKTQADEKGSATSKSKKMIPRVVISKKVYFGVSIQIYGEKVKITKEMGPSQFSYVFEKRKIGILPFEPYDDLY